MNNLQKKLISLSKEELIQLVTELQAELDRVRRVFSGKNEKRYNQSWSWVSKIVFAVQSIGKPVQSTTIADFLDRTDRHFKEYGKTRLNNLSVNITKAVKYKRLMAYKIRGFKAPYYCLPEWLDENGELLDTLNFEPDFK